MLVRKLSKEVMILENKRAKVGAPLAWGMGISWLRKHLLTLTIPTLLEQPSARHGVLGLLTRPG